MTIDKDDLADALREADCWGAWAVEAVFADELSEHLLGRFEINPKRPVSTKRWYVVARHADRARMWLRDNGLNTVTNKVVVGLTYDEHPGGMVNSFRGFMPAEGDELVLLGDYDQGPGWKDCVNTLRFIDRNGIFTERLGTG